WQFDGWQWVSLALTTPIVIGGIISGIAAQVARGCTSGQALTGGAQLALGSWIFMFAVFGGAYGLAYFVRKQWI
ncbi:MAG TPA: YeeE/YedE thiosulfate transporter family protein, partial [Polyangiaceae bacterium]|nr:YeeE/YedE thiosulfate transporter family protein [Polyangiaceae bacterium]